MNDDTARRLQIATESIDRMAKYAAHCDELIAAYKDVIARDDHEKQRVTPLPRDPKNQHAMLGHVETLAHRMAWRYKCSRDPNHSDTYTFNRATLLTFADALVAAERERVAVPVRLPLWLAEFVDAQEGTRADVIEAALLKAHKLKAPRAP